MLRWLKLSRNNQSGHLHGHEQTSYIPLGILLMIVGLALTVYTGSAASTPHPPPQAGSVGLTGTMPGPPPTTAATITTPSSGQHFAVSPVTVAGTCPKDTLVEIYKNDIFAGSAPCTAAGTFTMSVDLLIGQNILIARVYDELNQAGPDSNAVNIFYDALPSQASPLASFSFGGPQLLLNTDAVFRGAFPGQEMSIPISILGGAPPYAVNVQWGDASNKIVPRNDNATFRVPHTYAKAGTYQLTLQGTDSSGRVAFLTVAAIVNGQPDPVTQTTPQAPPNQLIVLWPLYVSAVAIVISFWLGERREKRVLQHRGLLLQS